MTTSVKGGLRPAWNLGRVLLAGLMLLLTSGKIRGPEPDRLARESIKWLYAEPTTVLPLRCHPSPAALLVGGMGFTLFSPALLLAGDVIRRLVAVVEFLVESELGRRRDRPYCPVMFPQVSTERRVLGCLFWTFEFPILNLFWDLGFRDSDLVSRSVAAGGRVKA